MLRSSLVLLLQSTGDLDGFLFCVEELVAQLHFVFELVPHFVVFLPETCQSPVSSEFLPDLAYFQDLYLCFGASFKGCSMASSAEPMPMVDMNSGRTEMKRLR
jgi:hypothetical protein